jgi:hypothetical protein
MSRAQLLLLGIALFTLVPVARADISWSVNFAQSTPSVVSDSGQSQVLLNIPAPVTGQNNATVVAPTMTVQSPVPDSHPDTFTHKDYHLSMALTDTASGASTTVNMTGYIQGTASQNSQNLQNVLTGVTTFPNIGLGSNVYNVDVLGGNTPAPTPVGSCPPPAPQLAAAAVAPQAGTQPQPTPEPPSLVLAGLGIAGLMGWKRRIQ